MFSCEYSEIFKNTFFHRTPLVAASEIRCHWKTCTGTYNSFEITRLINPWQKFLNKMKELILIKKANSGVTKFDQKYIILKGIKKFSHRFQNFIFQIKYFADWWLFKTAITGCFWKTILNYAWNLIPSLWNRSKQI